MTPAPPIVFADANVLYSAALRDILIDLTLAEVIRVRWSEQVLSEVSRAIRRQRPDIPEDRLTRLFTAMNAALPDAMIPQSASANLSARLPDPGDTHVLRSALQGGCTHIVTFNVSDFPSVELAKDGAICAIDPDTFLLHQLTRHAPEFLTAIRRIQSSLNNPVIPLPLFLDKLERCRIPQTAGLLRILLAR